MKVLVQRVREASVEVDGISVASIGTGILAFVGVAAGDTAENAAWMAQKLTKLRIFEDEAGKMNRSVLDIGGEVLLVSQFTLCADVKKGTRPSFGGAMPPAEAKEFFDAFVQKVATITPVKTGIFQAHMQVSLLNDGPITLMLEHS